MEKKQMSDVLLYTGDNLILLFPTKTAGAVAGQSPPAGRAFFFKILAADRLNQVYKQILAAETNTNYLAKQTGLDYDYLGEDGLGDGDDVLRIEDDPWWLYHFGYAPLQDSLRVYKKLEIGPNITGWEYRIRDEPDPEAGDDYGFIKGAEVVNYWDPPVETETIAFRSKEAGKMWQFGFYNESDELRIHPILNVVGRAYKLIPIIHEDTMRKMLIGKIPRRLITIDGLHSYTEETIIPREWKAVGNEVEVTFADETGVYARGRKITRVPITEETSKRLGGFMRSGETASETLERLFDRLEAAR